MSFLDTNNEWFHDKSDNTLYLYPDYGDLSNRTIKGKTTDYSVTFSVAQYVTLKKINFFATTFEMTGNSDYNTVMKCNFDIQVHQKECLEQRTDSELERH